MLVPTRTDLKQSNRSYVFMSSRAFLFRCKILQYKSLKVFFFFFLIYILETIIFFFPSLSLSIIMSRLPVPTLNLIRRHSTPYTFQGMSSSHTVVDIAEKETDITNEKIVYPASPTSFKSFKSFPRLPKIDAIRFSSNYKYAVTYSSESESRGVLIVWKIRADSIMEQNRFIDVTPTIKEDKWNIYIDISPDGIYVSASIFSSGQSTPPPMKIYYLELKDETGLEIYKPPKHMENLQGHGVFGSAKSRTFILCTDRWPWPNVHARIIIYDIDNNWALIKQLKTGYDFTWPIRWPMNFPPSFSIKLVIKEKTNVSNLFPRGARDHIVNDGGLARAIAQETLLLRSSTGDDNPKYYLQSWSIMTGSPQQSMDLRYISDTIPVISDNRLYKAVRTKSPTIQESEEINPCLVRVFSAATGCELAKASDSSDWQPIRFVGIAEQMLVLRNQHGDVRLWRFMQKSEQPISVGEELERYVDYDNSAKPKKRMNSITTSVASDPITFIIATTILQRPAIFRVTTKEDALKVEHILVPAILTDKFCKIERCTIYSRLTKAKGSKEYDIEPWRNSVSYKGWFSNLGNTDDSRYLVVGRSTVQLYSNYEEYGKPVPKLEFIWTIPIDAIYIRSVSISENYSELKVTYIVDLYHVHHERIPIRKNTASTLDQTLDHDGVRVEIDGLKKTVNGQVVGEEGERIEIIPIPSCDGNHYMETDEDFFYISSSLLNSLRFLMEKKMERSWRTSSPFCYNILDHARFYLKKHPLMLFDTVQQFTIRAPWSTKAAGIAGTTHRRMNEELFSLIKDLTVKNEYVPTIDHTIGTDLLSIAIKKRNTELVSDLVDYFTTRAIQDNIGFMIPITSSFKSLIKHYPDKAIDALRKTCFIAIGDKFTGSNEDFMTVPAYGTFQIRENILLADTARILGATIFLAIAFPLTLPTVILPITIILLPIYLLYKKKKKEYEEEGKVFLDFIEWIKQTLNDAWRRFYPDSWIDMTISRIKLLFWQPDHEREKFVFPLPNLCVYRRERSWFREWSFPSSPFTEICDTDNAELFGLPIWKGVLDFKWRSFARSRYYFLWALHCVILILFAYATKPSMDSTVYTGSYVPLYILIILSLFFLWNELRQLLYYSWRYFLSPYNYVDVITFLLVIWCTAPMLNPSNPILASKNSITILLLWIRFLFQTRIYGSIGIFVNVVIDVVFGIVPFLFVLTITLIGFSHAFWVLLGSDPDITPNYFTTYRNSTKYAFLALTGDPIGLSSIDKENMFSDIYRAMFSIFTVILLFNILIALLNNRYESAYERSQDVYMLQMAQIIAEIEIFFMAPWERQNSLKFPPDLIYEVESDRIKEYKSKLKIKSEVSMSTEERIANLEDKILLIESSGKFDEKRKTITDASKTMKPSLNRSGEIAAEAEALERYVQRLEAGVIEKDHKIKELRERLNKLDI